MKYKKLLRSCLAFHVYIYMCRFLPTPASGAQARPFRNAPIRTFQSNRLSQVIFGASDVWSLSNLAQFGSPRWGSQNSQIWGWPQQMLHGDTSIISWQRYMASLESWHELAHLLTSTYHWTKNHDQTDLEEGLKMFEAFHIISHPTHQRIRDLFTGRKDFEKPRHFDIWYVDSFDWSIHYTEDLEDWHVGRTASNPCFWARRVWGCLFSDDKWWPMAYLYN